MLSPHHLNPIQIGFDDHRRVANSGLLLPLTLGQLLSVGELAALHIVLG